jgi:hypothetical protein
MNNLIQAEVFPSIPKSKCISNAPTSPQSQRCLIKKSFGVREYFSVLELPRY